VELHLGRRVAFLRRRKGISQEVLSQAIYLSVSHLSNIEKGRYSLNIDNATEIAKYFNVPIEFLTKNIPNKNFDLQLEQIYEQISRGELDNLSEFFEDKVFAISLRQELLFNLLRAAYYSAIGKYHKAKLISEIYDFMLFEDINFENEDLLIRKHYYLYRYEVSYFAKEWDKCWEYCKLLFELDELRNLRGVFSFKLSQLLLKKGEYGKGLLQVHQTLELLEKIEDTKLLSKTIIVQSGIYIHLGLYNEVFELFDRMSEISEDKLVPEYKMIEYQHRGFICKQSNQYEEAANWYNKSLQLAEKPKYVFAILTNLIQSEMKNLNFVLAKQYIQEARIQILSVHEEMVLDSFIAEIALYEGDKKMHNKFLKKVLIYFEEKNLTKDLAYIYTYLASYYASQGASKKAIYYYQLKESVAI